MDLERTVNNLEARLSYYAFIPGLGILPGAAKVVMGTAQTVSALACSLISSIHFGFTGRFGPTRRACCHIKHGLGNIGAGVLEAIPFVGATLYCCRMHRRTTPLPETAYIRTHHEDKWMPYSSLIERDWRIESSSLQAKTRAQAHYKQSLAQNGGLLYTPLPLQLHLATQAIEETQLLDYAACEP